MSERWPRIGALFDQAIQLDAAGRERLLATCGEPEDITREVRSLLDAHDSAGDFLAGTAVLRSAPALVPGTMIGAYRVVGIAGQGGMGIVYEAEDTRLHRRVALKALPPDVAGDERQRARLRHEARAAAALQHPGIATVYALEEIGEQVFMATEFLAGRTLRQELADGALGAASSVSAALEIARALCSAHERGVVHRDLKPENIVRTEDGVLKILDFGLAQFETSPPDVTSRTKLTLPGMLVGTPAYMAPEQLLNGHTDFRADLFAFGILLYELCTGTHPFAADSLPATIARILAAPPTPASLPAALWSVIERCLEKEPSRRFSSTRDLLSALTGMPNAAARPGISAPEAPAPSAAPAVRWWRFHQCAAAVVYSSMAWPIWQIHRSLGRYGLVFFFVTLAAIVVATTLRLHLWFSSRVYPEDLPGRRDEVGHWIRWADVAFAALLIVGGIALPEARAAWAAVLISVGVGAAVAAVFIEPATARAAFRR